MVRSFALVKIYGMAREGRSLVSGQYPRVKARLVSLYWIAFLSAPTAQQPALEIQPRRTSGAVGVTSSWGLAAAC
ncbi:BQ5605_C093g13065 [Microbotryum silenes-dioicae]|uniref:BQ5605_C093g13065 protein n=1 Tax=Microbotryum silenes-dioicae TaxID=796604 RepID=A0A2X0LRS4_9BASI|nr:BQ5605_C093g13065 [Microbotryum silenes-dioicae]